MRWNKPVTEHETAQIKLVFLSINLVSKFNVYKWTWASNQWLNCMFWVFPRDGKFKQLGSLPEIFVHLDLHKRLQKLAKNWEKATHDYHCRFGGWKI